MDKITKIRQLISKQNIDAFLVTKPENILYLSNFKSSNAFILITGKKNLIFTDSRYFIEAKKTIPKNFKPIKISKKFIKNIPSFFKKQNIFKIGFEAHHLTYAKLMELKKAWKIKFKPINTKFIESIRGIKEQNELKKIIKSQQICDKILDELKKIIKPGITEIKLANEINLMAHKYGAEGLSFEPVVAFGKNSACPHHNTGNTRLKKGNIVLIDLGVKYKGYCSDITRVFFTQKPTIEQEKIFNIVSEAQNIAFSEIRLNKKTSEIENSVRKFLKIHKLNKFFSHSLGHGIGLEIHENPNLSITSNDKIQNNQIFTIEPGIYMENKFGIRIEDVVLMYGNKIKIISKSPKKLPQLIICNF